MEIDPLQPEARVLDFVVRELDASLNRSCGGMVDAGLLTSFLIDVGLDDCEPLLARLPSDLVHGATGTSDENGRLLRPFVRQVAGQVADLKLLTQLLETLTVARTARSFMLIEDKDDAEIMRLVHYSLCLTLVTRAMIDDVEVFETVVKRLGANMRAQPQWWSQLTLFEQSKVILVEKTMEKILDVRRSGFIDPEWGEIGLPANILVAVLEDLRLGNADNAYAGLALMRAKPGQLGDGATISHDGRCAVRMNMPAAALWRDLYISWNLALTTNFADSPYFAAAILNPCVLGAETAEFMFHRALALYVHLAGQIMGRVASKGSDPSVPGQATRDWRNESLTARWGQLNRDAARRYENLRLLHLRRAGLAGGIYDIDMAFRMIRRGAVARARRVYQGLIEIDNWL